MSSELDYQVVQQQVEAEIERIKGRNRLVLYGVHLALYLIFVILAWFIFPTINRGAGINEIGVNIGTLLTLGWTIMLVTQGIALANEKRGEDQLREQLIGRAITAEMMRQGLSVSNNSDKQKRTMRLSNDGELEELVDIPEEVFSARRMRSD